MNTPVEPPRKGESSRSTGRAARVVELKLYIARSTPNSVRAEQNLNAALDAVRKEEDVVFNIEIIDVFASGKRAILDNVIVTPTLIVADGGKDVTIVGDLSDTVHLHAMLAY